MRVSVAPIREWPIGIDPDEIDRARSPYDVERETHLRASGEHMRAIFRPVGRVGNLRQSPENALHIGGKGGERYCRRIGARSRADTRQRSKFRTYEECVDSARLAAKIRTM